MCSAFSQLQTLNRSRMGETKYQEMLDYGTLHLRFCMKLYKMQMDNGLYFLHEHPANAGSWKDESVQRILADYRVTKVAGNMCMFGMTQRDEEGMGFIKKNTGFMTNADAIAGRLNRRCDNSHRHIELINGRAKKAEIYPEDLCKEVIIGLKEQMELDGRLTNT